MTERETHTMRVARGWVDVWRRDDGVWGVSWRPYDGEPDDVGITYTPADPERPEDFPAEYDVERLQEWARRHWERAAAKD